MQRDVMCPLLIGRVVPAQFLAFLCALFLVRGLASARVRRGGGMLRHQGETMHFEYIAEASESGLGVAGSMMDARSPCFDPFPSVGLPVLSEPPPEGCVERTLRDETWSPARRGCLVILEPPSSVVPQPARG